MTLVYCGSLASVHSNKTASPSRVSATCSTSLRVLFFLAPISASTLRPALLPAPSECLCTGKSDHVAVDWRSWKLPRRFACGTRSPARTCAFLSRPCCSCAREYRTALGIVLPAFVDSRLCAAPWYPPWSTTSATPLASRTSSSWQNTMHALMLPSHASSRRSRPTRLSFFWDS